MQIICQSINVFYSIFYYLSFGFHYRRKFSVKWFCAKSVPGSKKTQLQSLEKRLLVFGILPHFIIFVKFTNKNSNLKRSFILVFSSEMKNEKFWEKKRKKGVSIYATFPREICTQYLKDFFQTLFALLFAKISFREIIIKVDYVSKFN